MRVFKLRRDRASEEPEVAGQQPRVRVQGVSRALSHLLHGKDSVLVQVLEASGDPLSLVVPLKDGDVLFIGEPSEGLLDYYDPVSKSPVKPFETYVFSVREQNAYPLHLESLSVSRAHLKIWRAGSRVYVMDCGPSGMGSKKGSWVLLPYGEVRLPPGTPVELKPGLYELRLGNSFFRITVPKSIGHGGSRLISEDSTAHPFI